MLRASAVDIFKLMLRPHFRHVPQQRSGAPGCGYRKCRLLLQVRLYALVVFGENVQNFAGGVEVRR